MQIFWYGESCFKIQNKERTILIDPLSSKKAGLRGPNLKADLLFLTSEEEEKEIKGKISEECFLISGPGEYEVKGVFVQGVSLGEKVIYRLLFEEINFGFLDQTEKMLDDEEIEKLGLIEVLFLPVGGQGVLEAEKAEKVLNLIEPKIIIPHSFKIEGLKISRDPLEKFLKKLDKKEVEPQDKLSLNKNDLRKDSFKEEVVILKPKTL